jgi:hypothetical protein
VLLEVDTDRNGANDGRMVAEMNGILQTIGPCLQSGFGRCAKVGAMLAEMEAE